jgi:formylglycine-generating enzyme required for sulfatase activity
MVSIDGIEVMISCMHPRSIRLVQALTALVLLVCLLLPLQASFANDIQITNLTVHPHNGGNGEVEFDLTWSNSWRVATEPYNWDAAWVFCKIRRNGGDWTHLKLSTTGHTIPQSPQAITTAMGLADPTIAHDASTNPAVGIFMYRSNDGFGTFTANDVRLRWSYADNGASSGDVVEIRVLAMEMVYIPEWAFYAGDNATSANAFREKETTDNDPWYISSENSITTTSGTSGNYYYPGKPGWVSGDAANSIFTIPASFPKGYGAFYMMKGEISQAQWVAFFNTLTSTQKTTRDITGGVYNDTGKGGDGVVMRNNISWVTGEATLPDQGGGVTYSGVAVNFLSWSDLIAYLDWSGLRPMSELEYEKAARGSNAAVSGEYAWGSTSITRATSITDSGLASERGNSGSNANAPGTPSLDGPLRVGSFVKGVNTRLASGGGFYGVMELSGNVWERVVSVGQSTGRTFEGRHHGNGLLDTDGNSDVTTWPGISADGSGFRGVGWRFSSFDARLSDRRLAAYAYSGRYNDNGGRGVRSAP